MMTKPEQNRSFMDDIEIGETTEYNEQVQSLKQIALQHISAISKLIAQELTKGYWEKKPVKVAEGVIMIKKYHPDLRLGYCNAVDFLMDIVYPFADEKFEQIVDEIYKTDDEKEKDIETLIKERKLMFREAVKMFERVNFFDSTSGVTE